mmetsp:Transcript_13284/g.46843  ORF Transcript_13284/g.46843 Transcript_13284/m.46843 type:complete len:292 (+) Transcript_13284:2798-3673(+)
MPRRAAAARPHLRAPSEPPARPRLRPFWQPHLLPARHPREPGSPARAQPSPLRRLRGSSRRMGKRRRRSRLGTGRRSCRGAAARPRRRGAGGRCHSLCQRHQQRLGTRPNKRRGSGGRGRSQTTSVRPHRKARRHQQRHQQTPRGRICARPPTSHSLPRLRLPLLRPATSQLLRASLAPFSTAAPTGRACSSTRQAGRSLHWSRLSWFAPGHAPPTRSCPTEPRPRPWRPVPPAPPLSSAPPRHRLPPGRAWPHPASAGTVPPSASGPRVPRRALPGASGAPRPIPGSARV